MTAIVRNSLRFATVVALALIAFPHDAQAQDKPTAKNVKPGAKVTLGKPLVVKMAGPENADSLRCTILQGDLQPSFTNVDDVNKPECVLSDLAEVGTNYKPGPARLVMDAWSEHTRIGTSEVPIEIVAPKPQGGAGKKFDARYWSNYGGGQGAIQVEDVVVKKGVMSLRIMIDKTVTFSPVTGIVVEKDGTILSQTVPLGAWTAVPGERVYPEERREADATKEITVSGKFETRPHGRSIMLRVEGALMEGQRDRNFTEHRFYRYGDRGEILQGSSSGGESSSEGGGGGGDACKKACFHEEATCSGNRGECLKARQQCVKACQ